MKCNAMLLATGITLFAAGGIHAESPSSAKAGVTQTISAFFAALSQGNAADFHKVTCPGFYAFDVGTRFSGDALFALVKKYQTAGTDFSWSVTQPDVHVDGKSAWIAYVNQGSVKNASGTKPMQWLESAELQKTGNGWCIGFLHSTPVSAK